MIRREFIIENYGFWTAHCICGHPITHHTPAAVAHRTCERENCDCVLFTESRGRQPLRRGSIVRLTTDEIGQLSHKDEIFVSEVPDREGAMPVLDFLALAYSHDLNRWMRESLDQQILQIHRNAQAAIERLYEGR